MAHDFNGNNIFTQEETGKISAVASIGLTPIDDSICDLSVDDMLNAINAGNKKTPETDIMEEASVEEAGETAGILRRHSSAALEERLKLEEAERKRREEEEKAQEEARRLKQEKLRRLNPLSLLKKRPHPEKKQEMEAKASKEEQADNPAAEEPDIKPTREEDSQKQPDKTTASVSKEKPRKKEAKTPKDKSPKEKPERNTPAKAPEKKNKQPFSFTDFIPFAKKDKTETADTPLSDTDDKDPLTGFLNEKAYNNLKMQDALGQSVVLVQVRGMDEIKNTFGQSACSLILITVSREIEKIFAKSTCYYIGKDKFVILPPASDNSFKKICGHVKALEDVLKLSSENDMMPYYISAGYCVAEKSLPFTEAVRTAEKILQEEISGTAAAPAETPVPEKEARKTEASAERQEKPPVRTTEIPDTTPDMTKTPMETPDFHEDRPLSGAEYDEQLTPAQRRLRASVINYHSQPTLEQIEAAVNMVESHYDRVTAVFMSDSEFTTLCVFRNVDTFIDIVKEAEYNIDYSYCYVLLESEIHCYGNDPDNNEVTKIFENLSNALKSGKISSKEDIAKINGINIFHNIILE